MAQSVPGNSSEEETLKQLFDDAMKLYDTIENGKDSTNSDAVQVGSHTHLKYQFSALYCVSFQKIYNYK